MVIQVKYLGNKFVWNSSNNWVLRKRLAYFLIVENFSKSYFRKGLNYSETSIAEILEAINLQNLSKINIFLKPPKKFLIINFLFIS